MAKVKIKQKIETLLSKLPFIVFLVVIIIVGFSSISIFGVSDPNELSAIEKVVIYSIEPLSISICVSLIYFHFQTRYQANNISDQFKKYSITMELAELLHQSKKNFGFKGLTGSINEADIIKDIIADNNPYNSKPKLRWMNFRFDRIEGYSSILREYLSAGGNIDLMIHSYDDDKTIECRMAELNHGLELTNSEAVDNNEYSNKPLYMNGLIQRTARLIQFCDSVKDLEGNLNVKFNRGNIGVPLFIVEQDIHLEAYIGFYFLSRSSEMPYVEWQTSPSSTVRHAIAYFDFTFENAVSIEEMKEKSAIKDLLAEPEI